MKATGNESLMLRIGAGYLSGEIGPALRPDAYQSSPQSPDLRTWSYDIVIHFRSAAHRCAVKFGRK